MRDELRFEACNCVSVPQRRSGAAAKILAAKAGDDEVNTRSAKLDVGEYLYAVATFSGSRGILTSAVGLYFFACMSAASALLRKA